MIYFLISWAIIGLLSLLLSGKAGLVAYNMKDYVIILLASGPLVWLLVISISYLE